MPRQPAPAFTAGRTSRDFGLELWGQGGQGPGVTSGRGRIVPTGFCLFQGATSRGMVGFPTCRPMFRHRGLRCDAAIRQSPSSGVPFCMGVGLELLHGVMSICGPCVCTLPQFPSVSSLEGAVQPVLHAWQYVAFLPVLLRAVSSGCRPVCHCRVVGNRVNARRRVSVSCAPGSALSAVV